MGYKITDKAKQNPLLIPLPYYPHENVGVGGPYEVNASARCSSCSADEQAAFEADQVGKPKRSFREAEPAEYQAIAEHYKATKGIPGILLLVADEQAALKQTAEKK